MAMIAKETLNTPMTVAVILVGRMLIMFSLSVVTMPNYISPWIQTSRFPACPSMVTRAILS